MYVNRLKLKEEARMKREDKSRDEPEGETEVFTENNYYETPREDFREKNRDWVSWEELEERKEDEEEERKKMEWV